MLKKLNTLALASILAFSSVPAWAADDVIPVSDPEEEESTAIEYETENDYYVTFKVTDFERFCLSETGDNLSYVTFELPTASQGSLWYDMDGSKETKVTASTKYYRNSASSSNKLIGNVSFVPKASFNGTATVKFKGYSNDRTAFSGEVKITVTAADDSGELDKITYEVAPGKKLKFSASDFNQVCRNAGFTLSYIKISQPDEEIGTLYYDYVASERNNTEVSSSSRYYRNSSESGAYLIDDITFVADKDATGNAKITYTAYNSDNEEFEGVITLRFDASSADVEYETSGDVVFFNASDINNACIDLTGSKVSYVKFSTPSKGTLYYDYDNEEDSRATVKSSTKYYYSKEPYLYLVGYVPKSDYSGTVIIDYTAYNLDGDSCNGSITIKVDTEDIEEAEDITYSIDNDEILDLDRKDFYNECKSVTGEKLDYVRFGTVSSGNLYYDYNTKKDTYDHKISSGRYYYDGGDQFIEDITYVPKSTYNGTATIKYTGYSVEGTSFTGEVKITVKSTSSSSSSSSSSSDNEEADDIKYTGVVGEKIYFESSDFNAECKELFGEKLDYVKFKLPSSSAGTLYCGKNEELESTFKCYYKSDDLEISDVYFVPDKSGKITINYTGRSEEADNYKGSVVITVTKADDEDEKKDEEKVETPKTGMENFGYITSYKTSLFTDIDESAWYGSEQTGAIKSAYRYGFVQGKGDKKFDPTGNITVAEAITIAARMADIYHDDDTEFKTTGTNWYDDYVDYAVKRGIITRNDFLNYNKTATRAEMAYIFAHVLPSNEYDKINKINSLPDVKSGLKYYDEIMLLYNAGVLSGNDEKGTFAPSTNITRAEVSAIVVRIADKEERRTNSF